MFDYALGLRALLASDLSNFGRGNVVGMAHSGGAMALTLSTICPGYPQFHYRSMVLIEPAIMHRKFAGSIPKIFERIKQLALSSRDTWSNREDALKWHLSREPWKSWDPEIVELFVVRLFRSSLQNFDLRVNYCFSESRPERLSKWRDA